MWVWGKSRDYFQNILTESLSSTGGSCLNKIESTVARSCITELTMSMKIPVNFTCDTLKNLKWNNNRP